MTHEGSRSLSSSDRAEAYARGHAIACEALGLSRPAGVDRAARARALAEGLVRLRALVDAETLA